MAGTSPAMTKDDPLGRAYASEVYRHIPRMRAPTSSRTLLLAARPAVPVAESGQLVFSNRPSSRSGMNRVRGEKSFAPLADEIRTLSGAPHRRILRPNRNSPHREATHDWRDRQ